jgi:pimeloyl-ACP methyl ester carboxylesterase
MTSLDIDSAPVRFVDLHGYRMAYRQWGDPSASDVVLLVHGITSSSLTWIRVAPALASRYRVVAVDLKGHGDSPRTHSGYRIADQADEIAGLCSSLKLDELTLIGHSWGGGIALRVATRGDVAVRRLILEDPAVFFESTPEQRQRGADGYAASVGLSAAEADARARPNLRLGWTEQDVLGKIDASMKGSPDSVRAVFEENGQWDLLELFAQLRCPTLVIRAEVARGGIVGATALERIASNPKIRVITLPDADHNIHRVQFDAFMAEVNAFLAAT